MIRVTDEQDGELLPRMYSYWPNAWAQDQTVWVFCGHQDGVPRCFIVDRESGQVSRMDWTLPYRGTTEGWYWDADGWIYLLEGPRLRRVNPFTEEDRIIIDITERHPGYRLWQAHSSPSGRTHSATVQRMVESGPYQNLGTLVHQDGASTFFEARGELDESALAGDEWVIIKESENNRVINLVTRDTQLIRDAERALGHSDCGADFLVGEADKPDPGACVFWDLRQPLTIGRCRILFETWNMGYIALRDSICLHSGDTHLSLVDLSTGALTPLIAHHNTGSDYGDRVKANLDPTGRVATYMSNQHGRRDVFLLLLP